MIKIGITKMQKVWYFKRAEVTRVDTPKEHMSKFGIPIELKRQTLVFRIDIRTKC